MEHGLYITQPSSFVLIAFSNAGWAGCPTTENQLEDTVFFMVKI